MMNEGPSKHPVSSHDKKITKSGKSCTLFTQDELIDLGLQGLVRANKNLVLLRGQKTILRRDYQTFNQVRLLGGGRAGYEPLYSGFVGPGMLTAACIGDKHSIPTFQTIFLALRELAHNSTKGIIVILENSIEGKLNFGLAVALAQREGILAKIVLVKDGCSDDSGIHRKGQVGVVLIYKIAAAMAEAGKCLEEIHDFCRNLSSLDLLTVNIRMKPVRSSHLKNCDGISNTLSHSKLTSCEVVNDIIQQKTACKLFLSRKEELVDLVLKYLFYNPVNGESSEGGLVLGPGDKVALLFNNCGSAGDLEISSIVNEISSELNRRGIQIEQIYVGTVMRSSCCTFSVTAMKIDDTVLKYLNHPTAVSAWPAIGLFNHSDEEMYAEPFYSELDPFNDKELGPILDESTAAKIGKIIDTMCLAVISCEDQINKISKEMFSENIGTLVKKSAEQMKAEIEQGRLNLKCPFLMFKQLSTICSKEMSSLVGTYYGIMFEGCSQEFIEYLKETPVSPVMWVNALEKGIQAIEHYSEVRRGEKSLLDALYPMLNVLKMNPEKYVEAAETAEMNSWKTVDCESPESYPSVETHIVAIWSRALAEGINLVRKEDSKETFSSSLILSDNDDYDDGSIIVLD